MLPHKMLCVQEAGPTDTMLISTTRIRPASRISEFACPRVKQRTRSTICTAQMQATASFRVAKNAASLISPIGPKSKRRPMLKTNCERQTSSKP